MNEANRRGLDTLEAWRRSMDFAVVVYEGVIPLLPATEKWNLQDQIRHAVSSVPAKIGEGHGRHYYPENIHYCYVARGSLMEVYSHVTLAYRLACIADDQFKALSNFIGELIRIIKGYIACLGARKSGLAGLFIRDESAKYSTGDPDESFTSDNLSVRWQFPIPTSHSRFPIPCSSLFHSTRIP